jgi:hypothetical protein
MLVEPALQLDMTYRAGDSSQYSVSNVIVGLQSSVTYNGATTIGIGLVLLRNLHLVATGNELRRRVLPGGSGP